ncbi:N-6 DNA methylase [Erysipelothrix anatis]|uniref:N-6 DNA methylase n=1 Tax=Erysipelothrix anatis TaxID=2683713 RepID=UPI0013593B32|nr:N-6 DNA methylase [Erysipelothrix anatis]
MSEKLIGKILNDFRGIVKVEEVSGLFAGLALLKFSNHNVIKNLVLKDKMALVHSLSELIESDSYEMLKGLPMKIEGIISSIPDSKYREILKAANDFEAKMLIETALMIEVEGYGVRRQMGTMMTAQFINHLIVGLAGVKNGDYVLDPTMGTGGTLVETLKESPAKVVGQEINERIAALAYIKLIVYGADRSSLEVYVGDSLESPFYLENNRKYDKVIQVPPFGLRLMQPLSDDKYGRFPFGPLTRSSGDWAFASNAISSLKVTGGKAVTVVPNGALFRSGPDSVIRQSILDYDLIETIISLPEGMFIGTIVPTSILVFNNNKEEKVERRIQFIKVIEEMVTIQNRRERILSEETINQILEAYHTKDEVKYFSVNISLNEIRNADLSVDSYVVQDTYDIDGMEIKVDFHQFDEMDTIPLGKIADIGRGYNLTRSNESEEGDYQVIRISDISEEGINYDNLIRTTSEGARIDNYLVRKGDLLLSIRGTTNKVGLVDREQDKLLVNANLVRIRPLNGYLPEWMKLYFESPMSQILLERISKGTTIRQVSIHDLRDFPIPKLTLEQQQQALDRYKKEMDKIERQLTVLKLQEHHVKRDFYNSMGIAEAFQIVD